MKQLGVEQDERERGGGEEEEEGGARLDEITPVMSLARGP